MGVRSTISRGDRRLGRAACRFADHTHDHRLGEPPAGDQRPNGALSRREIAVCTQILEGYFNEAIALNMGLSVHSVITYRRRAFAKLGISTLSELFAMVLRSKPNFSPPAVLRDTAFQITGCEEVADGRGHWDGSWAGQIAYTALTEGVSPRPSADGGGGRRATSKTRSEDQTPFGTREVAAMTRWVPPSTDKVFGLA